MSPVVERGLIGLQGSEPSQRQDSSSHVNMFPGSIAVSYLEKDLKLTWLQR